MPGSAVPAPNGEREVKRENRKCFPHKRLPKTTSGKWGEKKITGPVGMAICGEDRNWKKIVKHFDQELKVKKKIGRQRYVILSLLGIIFFIPLPDSFSRCSFVRSFVRSLQQLR